MKTYTENVQKNENDSETNTDLGKIKYNTIIFTVENTIF